MTHPKLTDSIDPTSVMTIEELWETLSKLSTHIVHDNRKFDDEYPIETRKAQMTTLTTLIKEIEKFHEKFGEGGENNE